MVLGFRRCVLQFRADREGNLFQNASGRHARQHGVRGMSQRLVQHLPHLSNRRSFRWSAATRALVVTLVGLVYCLDQSVLVCADAGERQDRAAEAQNTKSSAAVSSSSVVRPRRVDLDELPIPVQEMRDAILAAVESGDIDELRLAIDWNELRPAFQLPRDEDPIEFWRRTSKDGKGGEVLQILGKLLEAGPASLPIGRDFENNAVYVWPYLSEVSAGSLNAAEKTELFDLMPKEEVEEFAKSGKWPWYRLAIGADGTWHIFAKAAK